MAYDGFSHYIGFFPRNALSVSVLETKRKILAVLADGAEAHGYAIAKRLGLQPATVYEHLRELEALGLVSSGKIGRRRSFRLTRQGQMMLEALRGS